MRRGAAIVGGVALAALGCRAPADRSGPAPSASAAAPDRLAPLHAFEEERRRATDFAHLPASDGAFGPDPFAIRALPGRGPPRFVGLLRGRDAIVLLDDALREVARAPAPASPTGLAVAADGEILVVGEQSPAPHGYQVTGDAFRVMPGLAVGGPAHGLRDVALTRRPRAQVDYAVDDRSDTLFAWPVGESLGDSRILPTCAAPFRLAVTAEQLVVGCLLDHQLAVYDLDAHAIPAEAPRARVQHDGPVWAFDVRATPRGLLIAAGGVEDHPLDRAEGSFGYIDSFVFLYRLAPGAARAEKLAAVNVSALGVITPKVIVLRADGDGGAAVTVAGYGSDVLATLTWRGGFAAEPAVVTRPSLPGVTSLVVAGDAFVGADPLLDAWLRVGGAAAPAAVAVPDAPPAPRAPLSLVGEALFFTNLMAPWNRTEGRLSRFTCETCHFEGQVDGRTHHTGRGDVRATTKPLLGLFNNRPHFSRALDPDLATMVDNEFRVAGAKSEHDPWFSAADTGLAWLPRLDVPAAELDALALRRALMTFLMELTHRPNPAAIGRERFDERERRGAAVFARRCERCHAARLSTDDAASRVPEDRWEPLVLSREGPMVWARDGYHRTGVEPYVHELGARAPSLRRVLRKRPYFTSGSARSLADVLARARWQGDGFWHDRAPEGAAALSAEEREALGAFLALL